jgi:uncharacterized circularly permuted ATP-grasp superfamily protein
MKSEWFDEIRDVRGNVRPHYQALSQCWQSLNRSQVAKMFQTSREMFAGDYPQDPLPRVITANEFFVLRTGVEQRGRAIRKFLIDYYSGGRRWKRVFHPKVLRSILSRNHRVNVKGELKLNAIAFPFGPDIIRDQQGQWRIIEDSAGCLGGFGDLITGRKILLKTVPNYRQIFEDASEPKHFFRELAAYYKCRAKEHDGVAVFYPYGDNSDHEEERIAKIFRDDGILTVHQASGDDLSLRFQSKKVYLYRRGKKIDRVGYIVLRASPENMNLVHLLHALNKLRNRDIRKSKIEHMNSLFTSMLSGTIATNFSPGTRFINDKMFGIYVDAIIENYLGESPILTSIPAHSLTILSATGRWRVDERKLTRSIQHKDDYVFKRVDQDGGDGVWIGHKQTKSEIAKLADAIRAEPEKYIYQEFEHLSVLQDRIVDLRIHAHVDADRIIISNTPWGRANWLQGDGKVNLGSNGFTSPVVVV